MIDLNQFINVFSDEEVVPNAYDPNLNDIPDTLVYQRLRQIVIENGLQYQWRVTDAGRHPDGLAFVVGELAIIKRHENGSIIDQVVRPGVAEGPHPGIGLSGVTTIAFKNAALRGLAMAEFLYSDGQQESPRFHAPSGATAPVGNGVPQNPGFHDQGANRNTPPPQRFNGNNGQNNGGNGYGNNNGNGNGNAGPRRFARNGNGGGSGYNRGGNNGGYNRGGNGYGGGGAQEDWAQVRLDRSPRQGQFQGVAYANIPTEELQKWANGNNPNRTAIKELEFRAANNIEVGSGYGGFASNVGYGQRG